MTKDKHFDLPTTWVLTTLGDAYKIVGGGTPSTARREYWNGDVPWITSADIKGVREISVSRYVTDKGIRESATNKVPNRTLLVVTRVGLGKISIAASPMCFSQDLQGLVQNPELLLPEYVLYYLSFELQRLRFEGRGTTISGLTKKQLMDTAFPLSPQAEQRRVVDKIEELFSEVDKGVESLKIALEQLRVYRQAVLKHAFEGKLTEQWRYNHSAPAWTQTTLGAQLSFLTSGSRGWAKYYADSGDKFIRAQNLKYDRLDLKDIAFVELPNKSEGMRTRIEIGDLLITITGANVTKTAFVDSDFGTAYVSQHVALARPAQGSNTEFLYWYLVAEAGGRKQLNEFAYGAGKPGLNLDNIKAVRLSLPSPEEQEQIVSHINQLISIEESARRDLEAQIVRSIVLRQSILKRAFSGRLVAQDSNDEPASLLLERLRAEKALREKANGKEKKVVLRPTNSKSKDVA